MRKTITQIFPFLTPIRVFERNFVYFTKMYFDKNTYSKTYAKALPYVVSKAKTKMINEESGSNIIYQYNKVDNLKIASKTINQILIKPGETFSICYLLRKYRKYGKYKKGLVLVNGKIVPQKGGGLCHISNLIYYLFLNSPLTIIERHGHKVKSFANPDPDSLEGVDATINSGWLDLKVKNETDQIYQILIAFDEKYMYGKIMTNKKTNVKYQIINQNLKYIKRNNQIFEEVDIIKIITNSDSEEVQKLYTEKTEINYELPKNTKIIEES